MGDAASSLDSTKQCLKQDPEHKQCKSLFKIIKKYVKVWENVEKLFSSSRWKSTAEEVLRVFDIVESTNSKSISGKMYGVLCKCYHELHKLDETDKWCSKTIDNNPDDFDALCSRAETYLEKEMYEEAVRDFEKAHQLNQQDRRAHDGFQKAQRLLKQSKAKDYYKVLGIARSSSLREIKKAYRKLAQIWHPDKYTGDLPQDTVVQKMRDINEAYEVLSDEEKRQQFDNGIDPNEQQQGGFQHPFFHGGNPFGGDPFGGGGQQFHFKFN